MLMLVLTTSTLVTAPCCPRSPGPCCSPAAGGAGPAAAAGHSGADWRKWKRCGLWPLQKGWQKGNLKEERMNLRKMERGRWTGRWGKVNLSCPTGLRFLSCWEGHVGSDNVCHTGRNQMSWKCDTVLLLASTPWTVGAGGSAQVQWM